MTEGANEHSSVAPSNRAFASVVLMQTKTVQQDLRQSRLGTELESREATASTDKYSDEEVARILNAYNRIFPPRAFETFRRNCQHDGDCTFASLLISDSSRLTTDSLTAFERDLHTLNLSDVIVDDAANRLLKTSQEHSIGFSLGISPWTDYELLQTGADTRDQLIVVLAHDWYPIISYDEDDAVFSVNVMSPLLKDVPDGNYKKGFDPLAKKASILFLNLFPGLRAPCAKVTDEIKGVSYSTLAENVIELISGIDSHEVLGVVMWGRIVWESFRNQIRTESTITEAVEQLRKGKVFPLPIPGGHDIQAIPFFHPASRLFNRKRNYALYLEQAEQFNLDRRAKTSLNGLQTTIIEQHLIG